MQVIITEEQLKFITEELRSNEDDFEKYARKIIDNLEGGYYNPNMKLSEMGRSGETMYGMDRDTNDFEKYGSGKSFWKLIDDDRKKTPSCYVSEYMPEKGIGKCYKPELAEKLKSYLLKYQRYWFDMLCAQNFNKKEKSMIVSTPKLFINFIYCVWNSPMIFKDFAKYFKKKLNSGITNPEVLANIMIKYRRNYEIDMNNKNASDFMSKI